MNLNKVMNFISENNIQPDAVFALVDKAEENKLVRDIMTNGVNENIFNSFNKK